MFAICWTLLSTSVLLCGPMQPAREASVTFKLETERYNPALEEFAGVSAPMLLPQSAETLAAHARLNTVVTSK